MSTVRESKCHECVTLVRLLCEGYGVPCSGVASAVSILEVACLVGVILSIALNNNTVCMCKITAVRTCQQRNEA